MCCYQVGRVVNQSVFVTMLFITIAVCVVVIVCIIFVVLPDAIMDIVVVVFSVLCFYRCCSW